MNFWLNCKGCISFSGNLLSFIALTSSFLFFPDHLITKSSLFCFEQGLLTRPDLLTSLRRKWDVILRPIIGLLSTNVVSCRSAAEASCAGPHGPRVRVVDKASQSSVMPGSSCSCLIQVIWWLASAHTTTDRAAPRLVSASKCAITDDAISSSE